MGSTCLGAGNSSSSPAAAIAPRTTSLTASRDLLASVEKAAAAKNKADMAKARAAEKQAKRDAAAAEKQALLEARLEEKRAASAALVEAPEAAAPLGAAVVSSASGGTTHCAAGTGTQASGATGGSYVGSNSTI